MENWVALNMTSGIGARSAAKLLERFGSPEAVFGARRSELEQMRLKPATIESLIKREHHDKAAQEIKNVKDLGGEIIALDDGVYPYLLREIADPPIVLYVLGKNWRECFENPCVAFVGSRRASTYGVNASEMFSRELASRGITIISGLARGIDAASHCAAIESKGRTVAVMGTGLDEFYPRENKGLGFEIVDSGGAIVTQFPLGTPPLPENFPYRNRIISGLSLGVLVVEATDRSGSLITARLANEQNREVFAVPGNVTSANSFGTNYLIKSAGAKLVQQWQDVVSELPQEIAAAMLPPETSVEKKKKKAVKPETEEESKVTQPELAPDGLNDDERTIWLLLSSEEQSHIDNLATASGLSFGNLSAALFGLEMQDAIRVLPGKCYARKM
ncbi:MAG: DNA-protecting protein DprA [Pyrinomonadaceae bacterium]|nr:DNA-protecting protein DprA [Pyrinomonadaceae bacterium]